MTVYMHTPREKNLLNVRSSSAAHPCNIANATTHDRNKSTIVSLPQGQHKRHREEREICAERIFVTRVKIIDGDHFWLVTMISPSC
jgi:hypothetical protein